MDYVKKYDIPKGIEDSFKEHKVFGKDGYIEQGDAFMSITSLEGNEVMPACSCSYEVVCYIAKAQSARVCWGPEKNDLTNENAVNADNVIVFDPGEWFTFAVDGEGGFLEFTKFIPANDPKFVY